MSKALPSNELVRAIGDLVGVDPAQLRRLVIDIRAGDVPVIHVELYGDDRIINVVRALEGVHIERVAAP